MIAMKKKVIVFQGDSITDAGRDREIAEDLGKGYPNLVAARLGLEQPGVYRFYNRGVSGDRIVDIYARMKRDILNLQPDYLSILVGVNDVWHELDFQNGVEADKFKQIYRMLLAEVLSAIPTLKIMLLEPYVMKGCATASYYARFRHEVSLRAVAVRELAEEFRFDFIPLQEPLESMAALTEAENYLADGVHPLPAFHQYLADRWLQTFRNRN